MNLCSSRHEEICYTGRKCPLCEAIEEKEELQSQLDSANETIALIS